MMNWLLGLLASISSVFVSGANKPEAALPVNTEIIAYQETYYTPTQAEPGNFPWAKKISEKVSETPKPTPPPPAAPASLPPAAPSPAPAAPTLPPSPPQDPYLANPEPSAMWLSMGLTLIGNSFSDDDVRTLPEVTFDREYWKIDVTYYWAPSVVPPKPEIINDYFKLEVYEKGTNKLVYTMASGKDDKGYPRHQAFRKPGTYYFKVYAQDPSQWEMTFWVSSKLAQ